MTTWDELIDEFALTIAGLEPREFLIMQAIVGEDPNPYAQVAREPDGSFYCEAVSAHHLPADVWPIDEWALVAAGWEPPVGRVTNWSHATDTAVAAARLLVEALRLGRLCGDPRSFVGTIDRWPPPPDGGNPEPVRRPGPFGLAA